MSRTLRVAAIGSLTLIMGCGESVALRSSDAGESIGIEVPVGSLRATPGAVDFGEVCIGSVGVATIALENVGDAALDIVDVETSYPSEALSFKLTDPEGALGTLEPGTQRVVEFEFNPSAEGQLLGTVTVHLGSFIEPLVLEAFGAIGGPKLFASPETVDLGAVAVGDRVAQTLVLRNIGTGVLSVSNVTLEPEVDDLTVGLASGKPWRPQALESGASLELEVALSPQSFQSEPEGALATLNVSSNDCLSPSTDVPVDGWPGGLQTPCPDPPTRQERSAGKDALAADILFIVDNSDSMEFEQKGLAAAFTQFIETAEALGINYRLGVTTTDASEFGSLRGELVTPSNVAAFSDAVQVGIGGSDEEQGLHSAALSVSPGGPFSEHIRDGSVLSLVFVSDEEDKSAGAALDYIAQYEATPASQLLVHAIVEPPSLDGDDACETAELGARYIELAEATGGYYDTICTADFSPTLFEIGARSFGYRTTFNLSDPALPGSVTVMTCPTLSDTHCDDPANRSVCPDWTLSADGLTVRFEPTSPCLPSAAEEVIIDYELICGGD